MARFVLQGLSGLTLCLAGAAAAQSPITTEVRVDGNSGLSTYSVRVIGADGLAYNCRPDVVEIDGRATRLCQLDDSIPDPVLSGGSVTENGLATLGVIVAIALVATDDDSAVSTTTTTGATE